MTKTVVFVPLKALLCLSLSVIAILPAWADVEKAKKQPHTVPMYDLRGVAPKTVLGKAGITSRDSLVMVFFGEDPDAYQAVLDAANLAISEGLPVKAVVLASPRPIETFGEYKVGTLNEVVYFANVYQTRTTVNAEKSTLTLKDHVFDALKADHQKFIVEGFHPPGTGRAGRT